MTGNRNGLRWVTFLSGLSSAIARCAILPVNGHVDIPQGVPFIGGSTNFLWCTDLVSVTIPNSVTAIGDDAFYGCSNLLSVAIPNSVTAIGEDAFFGCSNLVTVNMPNSVTAIGEDAFYRCGSLSSMVISSNVTIIGRSTFFQCTSLSSVSIPSRATIGENAFYGCTALSSVTFSGSVTDGRTFIGDSSFFRCRNLRSIAVPSSVTAIGRSAFYGCTRLSLAILPNGVTTIGRSAFFGCTSLSSITMPSSATVGRSAFYNCPCGELAYFPGTVLCNCSARSCALAPTAAPTTVPTVPPSMATTRSPSHPQMTNSPTVTPTILSLSPSTLPTRLLNFRTSSISVCVTCEDFDFSTISLFAQASFRATAMNGIAAVFAAVNSTLTINFLESAFISPQDGVVIATAGSPVDTTVCLTFVGSAIQLTDITAVGNRINSTPLVMGTATCGTGFYRYNTLPPSMLPTTLPTSAPTRIFVGSPTSPTSIPRTTPTPTATPSTPPTRPTPNPSHSPTEMPNAPTRSPSSGREQEVPSHAPSRPSEAPTAVPHIVPPTSWISSSSESPTLIGLRTEHPATFPPTPPKVRASANKGAQDNYSVWTGLALALVILIGVVGVLSVRWCRRERARARAGNLETGRGQTVNMDDHIDVKYENFSRVLSIVDRKDHKYGNVHPVPASEA